MSDRNKFIKVTGGANLVEFNNNVGYWVGKHYHGTNKTTKSK